MKMLKQFLKWAEGALGTLKTFAILILLTMFLISIFVNGCDRQQTNDLVERITGLNVQNDILMKKVKERGEEIQKKDSLILQLNDSLREKDRIIAALRVDYSKIKAQKEEIPHDVVKIPSDSSYRFLDKVAYPYEGQKKFPFNEPQVKDIHITFLERESLERLNYNLLGQVGELEDKIEIKDEIEIVQEQIVMEYKMNEGDYKEMIENKDEIIDEQDKEIKKENRTGIFYKITTFVATILLVVSFFI